MELEKIKQLVPAEEIKGDLVRQKAMELVRSSAVVGEPEAQEADAEEAPAKPKRKSTKKAAEPASEE
ncbi:hypothetical protein SDC9_186351 [bioreactor metagenome]|uniref:Trigger factor C-terminal domain-containing protein n=1 Tax=bioreactor metagenome TaxID=1076179 RepID=A0A645HJQ0_9ZZZZ